MLNIVKVQPKPDREAFIQAMWLMFLRTPCRSTKPGEPVDLGEIGEVREKNWTKATPYSLAENCE